MFQISLYDRQITSLRCKPVSSIAPIEWHRPGASNTIKRGGGDEDQQSSGSKAVGGEGALGYNARGEDEDTNSRIR